ncbi:transforming growth factor beta-1-induced transcript 1 protein-like isoform X1 [Culicoides brevitarsis]|uniref:transforming growth factor beta-1-induced transcript 1 protein-like isoform X1 n=1 Tax=Culicoides brevitarsis TaxID=469753 RepID=UPI00307B94A7
MPEKCFSCKETTEGKQPVKALGKTWCHAHFQCKDCKVVIGDSTFKEKENLPVCLKCYQDKYVPFCVKCKEVRFSNAVSALEKTWHRKCFVCNGLCKKPLGGQTFFERDGNVYCKSDFEKVVADKCAGCKAPIMKSAITALQAKWHPDCFKCKKCKKTIDDESFYVEGSKPVCAKCIEQKK